jgi:hypothetical protein
LNDGMPSAQQAEAPPCDEESASQLHFRSPEANRGSAMSQSVEQAGADSRSTFSCKERADVLLALLQSNIDQFNHLGDVSWKLRLAVWTGLAAATAFILSTDKRVVGWLQFIVGTLLTLLIAGVVIFVWSPFTHTRSTRRVRIVRHWEEQVEKLVGSELPSHLTPRNSPDTGDWATGDTSEHWSRHPVYMSSALVTALFCALVILALYSRLHR